MKIKHRISIFIVTIVMAVVLPFLAYLQYTWLGQLSEQEYQHLHNNLRTSAFHCTVEFNQQLIGFMQSISGPLEKNDTAALIELESRIKQWKAKAPYPQMVPDTISITTIPRPETANELREESGSLYVLKDISGIVLPLAGNAKKVVFISLNTAYITSSLLPEFIRSNFLTTTSSEYEFVITDNNGASYFHSIGSTPQTTISEAEIAVPFLMFPPPLSAPPGSALKSQQPLFHRDNNSSHIFIQRPHEQYGDAEFISPPNIIPFHVGNRDESRQNRSRLYIKCRTGSLETIVTHNRIRNLCMSFGVLIFLGASVMLLVISSSRAGQLARQQMEFVAGVSHELRTPLAVLKSAGENLADGVIYEKKYTQKYGALIKSEVVRLSDMVEKALTYATIQSGKRAYEFHDTNISGILNKTLDELNKRLPRDGFTIDLSIAKDLPTIQGNEIALQSAFENILANAIKYSGESKWAQVTATMITSSKNKRFIEIAFQDHGIGIASDSIQKVFVPFYRGQNAVELQIQGSGLGLSIAKHIVEAHGGKIALKSVINVGSTITIQLPVTEDVERTI